VLAERGDAPGLVHVISAMEACPSYKPWLDKNNGRMFLRPDTGKCLRLLGLIKKVAHTYRCYLTRIGRSAIAAACSLTRFNIIPAMTAVR
jgi:hypothetical protein